ncbi:MAG TPA: protein TolR [Desulfobacteraceae bacterium]|nr:protein TolR [Desulfobacteraceae bacterium]
MEPDSSNRFMSNINVTPLVDVMLVLLIIFMITAPMMMQGVEVNLPKASSKGIYRGKEPLIITISKDRSIYVEDHAIDYDEIEDKIRVIMKYRESKEVALRADKVLPYGYVIKVISKLKKAGIRRLGMITEPVSKRPLS